MVPSVYGNKLSYQDWENSFSLASRGLSDPPYIAAMQRALASQADCLILMGGGRFQLLAYEDYLMLHPDPSKQCVQYVCRT